MSFVTKAVGLTCLLAANLASATPVPAGEVVARDPSNSPSFIFEGPVYIEDSTIIEGDDINYNRNDSGDAPYTTTVYIYQPYPSATPSTISVSPDTNVTISGPVIIGTAPPTSSPVASASASIISSYNPGGPNSPLYPFTNSTIAPAGPTGTVGTIGTIGTIAPSGTGVASTGILPPYSTGLLPPYPTASSDFLTGTAPTIRPTGFTSSPVPSSSALPTPTSSASDPSDIDVPVQALVQLVQLLTSWIEQWFPSLVGKA